MTQSFREAIQAAARAEPAVGDPYARFLRRRRRSRGLRTLLGVVVASMTMFGFVRIFPGGTGVTPNDGGFLPGNETQPGFESYQRFDVEPLALSMLVPAAWTTQATAETARIGPALSEDGRPATIEVWFGQFDECDSDACTPLSEAIEDRASLHAAGVTASDAVLHVGSLPMDVTRLRFPSRGSDAIAPWCSGCVGYFGEVGAAGLPMLVLARNDAVLTQQEPQLRTILRTVYVG